MPQEFDLESYLTQGVENLVKGAVRATLSNPKQSLFMAKYAIASKTASKRRSIVKENGEHVPTFLIASITSKCNLHCAGCYSRFHDACNDSAPVNQLTDQEWLKIFDEAKELGIAFILLAGGEPLMRKDIIEASGKIPEIIFPVFTNGTMIDQEYIRIFDKYRNLLPVLSIEGGEEITNERRGEGVYQKLTEVMVALQENKILYGASVTVTTANLKEVTSEEFLHKLSESGCKVVFFIEFVPVTPEAKELAPGEEEREYLKARLEEIRMQNEEMILVSFPGDEKSSGGCLAAGRGFFHINSHGGAEPCPFSPYSDISVKDTSLKDAMQSKLFRYLRENDILMEEHAGGCVLFERRELVESLLSE